MNTKNFNESQERQDYIKKLANQTIGLKTILKIGRPVLQEDVVKKLNNILEEAELLYDKLTKHEFEIAIVGLEKAGKSSFANALMEIPVLPTDTKRCTYTATKIKYDKENSATVTFYDRDTFDKDFKDKLKKLRIEDYNRYSFDTLSTDHYENLEKESNKDLDEDIREIIENKNVIKDYLGHEKRTFDANQIKSEEFKEFITDPGKARAVKNVVIYSNKLTKMPNAVIYDVPGFNSPTELHKTQTKERMDKADAIVVVANGEHPSITSEPLKILQESDKDGNLLKDKLFVFANRIDCAPTDKIVENIETTYQQWIKKYHFLSDSQSHRIVFGSALAHQEPKTAADLKEKISELKNETRLTGDGVDEMRKKLEDYNENERFEILKKRINAIRPNIQSTLGDILKTDSTTFDKEYKKKYLKISNSLQTQIAEIKKELEQIVEKVQKDMNIKSLSVDQWPLSKKIVDYINKNITIENYSVESAKHFGKGRIGSEETSRTEGEVREEMFERMYNDFIQNIVKITDELHSEYSSEVLETILSTMGVGKNNRFREEIEMALKKELEPYWHYDSGLNSGFYFRSLIERYSRDIYEVLINAQYTEERLTTFYKYADNFFSMSVFYKEPGTPEDDLSYITKAPQDQPLCQKLLFHSENESKKYFATKDEVKDLTKEVQKITKIETIPDETIKKLERALNATEGDSDKIKKAIRNNFDQLSPFADKEKRLITLEKAVENLLDTNSCGHASISDKLAFGKYYNNFHAEAKSKNGYTIEYFKKEFYKDINTLQDVLVNAFVRAISIETPFSAREVQAIADTIKYLESDKFNHDFIEDHIDQIKMEEVNRLDDERNEKQKDLAIIELIKGTLENMNNSSVSETGSEEEQK